MNLCFYVTLYAMLYNFWSIAKIQPAKKVVLLIPSPDLLHMRWRSFDPCSSRRDSSVNVITCKLWSRCFIHSVSTGPTTDLRPLNSSCCSRRHTVRADIGVSHVWLTCPANDGLEGILQRPSHQLQILSDIYNSWTTWSWPMSITASLYMTIRNVSNTQFGQVLFTSHTKATPALIN